ncbi:MAG: exodeoxyribonuclease VII large subunit [Candidatus Saelkia tenebricola]|nr:exodeoxyribonuclease VII large subunit [Candidatus Saelkia tenebricola]
MDERHIYSITELTRSIKDILEGNFGYIWVEGEISNLRCPDSGHIYFTLKDKNSELKSVLFKFSRSKVKFDLEDGIAVVGYGQITVYEKSGQYQLRVERMEPKGIGALMLRLEKLKKKLQKEGLFDEEHKKEIPFLPQKIGIVTSATGAAIKDIIKILKRRFSNMHILIYPVRVQGIHAGREIAEAIEDLNKMEKRVDIIITGRGGGSIEDLMAFNEEEVGRAIFKSKIPIISAVGHEHDWTISDMVADLRAATPSAAAELVVQKKSELEDKIYNSSKRIRASVMNMLDRKRENLEKLSGRYGLYRIKGLIPQKVQRLDEIMINLERNTGIIVKDNKERLKAILRNLENLNPLSILLRGYSITLDADTGKVLKTCRFLKTSQLVKTKLHKGSFISRVEKIDSN